MRVGQTSFVVFLSKFLGSALGFFATIYFARELGAEVLGHYFLVVAIVAWLMLGGHLGVSGAVTKRLSEGEEQSAYFTAGLLLILGLGFVMAIGALVFQTQLEEYVGVSVSYFVVIMLLTGLLAEFVRASLKGDHLVHIAGVLVPINIGFRSLVQLLLVVTGFGLAGLLAGWAIGATAIVILGLIYLSVTITRPRIRHFRSLVDYAKFSWLGSLQGRAYNDADVLILGALVSSAFVGIYAVAWSIANFLILFGNAVSEALFPEISRADTVGDDSTVARFVNDSLAFAGLFIIPGFVGGTILADRILRIYGPEFTQGTAVFSLLVLAVAFYSYQKQLLSALNAIDRPDITFKINAVFIAVNVVLNVVLVVAIGFVGAAIATATSTGMGLAMAFFALRPHVEFTVPVGEIGRQCFAAFLMGLFIYAAHLIFDATSLINHNAAITVFLVTLGGGLYFFTLMGISPRFRETVHANSPVPVPDVLRGRI